MHCGGFAGTIQGYVYEDDLEEYDALVESVLGPSSVEPIAIRVRGAGTILQLSQ